jgi:hypothetical protein
MTRKQHILCLAVFSLVLVERWLDLTVRPRPLTDIYGFWSRLVPLVLGSLAYVMWVGVLIAESRRAGGPRPPQHPQGS